MTNERTTANTPDSPVSTYENERVGGLAHCDKLIFADKLTEAQRLRDQQAKYYASLPTDPAECLTEAIAVLYPLSEENGDCVERALHLSVAMTALIDQMEPDHGEPQRATLLYIADQITWELSLAVRKITRVADILKNPARIEREARTARPTAAN